MAKEEVIVQDNKEVVKQTYEYERIDFSVPSTVITYGDEAKFAMSEILNDAAQNTPVEKELQIDEKKIASLSNFEEMLEEKDKKAAKKLTGLGARFRALFNRQELQEDFLANSYKKAYSDYCGIIDDICTALESQKQRALKTIEMRKQLIENLGPYIKMLDEIVRIGFQDAQEFADEIEKLKVQEPTQDTLYEINYKTRLLEEARNKLNRLQKGLISYKELIQAYRIGQMDSMTVVDQSVAFISDQAPILEGQGSIIIQNHQDKRSLETLKALSDATNLVINKNSEAIVKNAETAGNLILNGGIRLETLMALDASVKRGQQIYKSAISQKQIQNEKERLIAESISKELDNYQSDFLSLVEEPGVVEALGGTENGLGTGYTKKLIPSYGNPTGPKKIN